jgi:hypothetical protein
VQETGAFKKALFLPSERNRSERVAWKAVKCIRQFALIAVRNVKFPSNLTQVDQFTAENAGLKEDRLEDPTEDTKHIHQRH